MAGVMADAAAEAPTAAAAAAAATATATAAAAAAAAGALAVALAVTKVTVTSPRGLNPGLRASAAAAHRSRVVVHGTAVSAAVANEIGPSTT